MKKADEKIYQEVKEHSELMAGLEYLNFQHRPRLTGSKKMQNASDGALKGSATMARTRI